jgi:hypothetical protein
MSWKKFTNSVDPKFKTGEIVYFNIPQKAKYSNNSPSGSYEYHFTPGVPYRIEEIRSTTVGTVTGSIINLEDGKSHFLHGTLYKSLISAREWNLNKILED